jgi:predicted phage terminase large subunit-like protein
MEVSKEEMLADALDKGRVSLVEHFRMYHSGDDVAVSPKFHYQISDILIKGKDNFVIEAFRESAKTSLVVLDFPTYLLQYPVKDMSYVVIIKQNQKLAEDKLRQVSKAYQSHPILSLNLVRVIRDSAAVFEAEVKTTEGETMNIIFEAYGKGAALRGLLFNSRRPQLVIIDDPQDFEDSRSESTLKRDWDWFLSDVKPLGKNVRIFVIGNNLGEQCLVERIFEFSEALGFKCMRIAAIKEDGTAAWPEQFPISFLENEKEMYRVAGKIDIWYRERMCVAASDENRDFKSSYFRYYSDMDTPRDMFIKIGVDPAISKKDTADYTGITVAGITETGEIYILETIKKRMLPDEIIDTLFGLVSKWNREKLVEVGIENVQYQKMLILEVQKQMKMRGKYFMLREVQPYGEKEARIRAAMQARYAAGSIFHRNFMAELEDELLSFPFGKNDDLIDSESIAVTMCDMYTQQKDILTYKGQRARIGAGRDEIDELFAEDVKVKDLTRPIYHR